jgi:GH18 family chitinase
MLSAGECASSPDVVNSHPLGVFAVYTTDWAQYRNITNDTYDGQPVVRPAWCKNYGYTPSHLDASLFTHIIYAFAKVEAGTYAVVSLL